MRRDGGVERERERERETVTVWRYKNISSPRIIVRLRCQLQFITGLVLSSALEQVDHKIFRIPQKCNNTANIFVWEYIVDDALTIGCAAEIKFMNITLYYIVLNPPHIRDDVLYLSSRSWCRK